MLLCALQFSMKHAHGTCIIGQYIKERLEAAELFNQIFFFPFNGFSIPLQTYPTYPKYIIVQPLFTIAPILIVSITTFRVSFEF